MARPMRMSSSSGYRSAKDLARLSRAFPQGNSCVAGKFLVLRPCIGPDLGVKYNMLWYPLDRRYIREYCAVHSEQFCPEQVGKSGGKIGADALGMTPHRPVNATQAQVMPGW